MKNPAFFFAPSPSDFNPIPFSPDRDYSSPTGQPVTHFPIGGQMDSRGFKQLQSFGHEH